GSETGVTGQETSTVKTEAKPKDRRSRASIIDEKRRKTAETERLLQPAPGPRPHSNNWLRSDPIAYKGAVAHRDPKASQYMFWGFVLCSISVLSFTGSAILLVKYFEYIK
ncbi:hypothetical protein PFISCL1PPCAC_1367, partial [Pristionchus fissidentatus]